MLIKKKFFRAKCNKHCLIESEGIREKQQFYKNDIFTQFIFISQHCHIVIIIIIESHNN